MTQRFHVRDELTILQPGEKIPGDGTIQLHYTPGNQRESWFDRLGTRFQQKVDADAALFDLFEIKYQTLEEYLTSMKAAIASWYEGPARYQRKKLREAGWDEGTTYVIHITDRWKNGRFALERDLGADELVLVENGDPDHTPLVVFPWLEDQDADQHRAFAESICAKANTL